MNSNCAGAIRGKFGEEKTSEYLKDNGFTIIKQNYHIRGGEIDIIAADSEYIAFVEVKTRKFNSLSEGWEAVTKGKKERIIKAAEKFLDDNDIDLQPRFDVAYITVTTEEIPNIIDFQYFASDFDATGYNR